jgi:hypothetical protein
MTAAGAIEPFTPMTAMLKLSNVPIEIVRATPPLGASGLT